MAVARAAVRPTRLAAAAAAVAPSAAGRAPRPGRPGLPCAAGRAALRVDRRSATAARATAPAPAGYELRLPADPEYCSTCIFPTEWAEAPLIAKSQYNHDSVTFTFGLPEGASLALPVCACLLLRGYAGAGADAEVAVRPYTPTSSNEVRGSFDLLVKVYENGVVSKWLDGLALGTFVGFKHIPFNIKAQYPFDKRKLVMVAGGTGITPMYQALQMLIPQGPEDRVESIALLYGNKFPEDILLKDELDELAARSDGRLTVTHVVGTAADQAPIPGWDGALGWVDEAKFKAVAPPPADDVLVMVCGLPALYESFCGPRTEAHVAEGSILARLGYGEEMVAKF